MLETTKRSGQAFITTCYFDVSKPFPCLTYPQISYEILPRSVQINDIQEKREREKDECKYNEQETFFGLLLNKYKCSIKYENASVRGQSILPVTVIIKRLYRHQKCKRFVFALLSTTQFTYIYVGCRCYNLLLFVSSVHFFASIWFFAVFLLGTITNAVHNRCWPGPLLYWNKVTPNRSVHKYNV